MVILEGVVFVADLNDGKNFTTMEWLMVFCQITIAVDGFSMFFFTCEPLVSMVFQWFFSCEPLASMVFQWFFRFQPLVSMVFPMFFSNPTNPIFRQNNLAQCTMCILGTTMALWSKAEIQKYTF